MQNSGKNAISEQFSIFIFTITQNSFNKIFTKKNYQNPFRITKVTEQKRQDISRKTKKEEIFRNWSG
jgi:hypothetical protein